MKKKSILISAIAMLAVSAIVLSTATYAWFTGSITPSITNVKVGVVERNLLALSGTSLDGTGTDWRPVLDTTATTSQFASGRYINKWFDAGGAATNAANGLDAVTPYRMITTEATPDAGTPTVYPVAITGLPTVTPVFNGSPIVVNKTAPGTVGTPITEATLASDMGLVFFRKDVADTAGASTYYRDTERNAVAIRFMMRADKACSVSLKLKTNTAGTDVHTYFDSSSLTHSTNDATQVLIDYSLRMAFVFSEEFNPTAATPTTYAAAEYDDIIIWSPYGDADQPTPSIREETASGFAEGHGYAYDAMKPSSTATDLPLFNFTSAMGVREVVCYIWVEGADLDCVDSVAGGLFSALIAFTGSTTPVGP